MTHAEQLGPFLLGLYESELDPAWETALGRTYTQIVRWMRTGLRPGAFVFSDCEGYEGPLFTSEPIPHLASATLIIETHDELNPGVTGRIGARLAATADSPRRESTRDLSFLSGDERRLATHEVRGPQTWLLCVP